MLLVGVSLSSQSYYDTNYAFGGNYGVSSFGGIGSFGFGGSAIGGRMKPKPTTYIFKPKKVRHVPVKHKIVKPTKVIDQWPQPSNVNFAALKPVEVWPQPMVIDESYLKPVPLQQTPVIPQALQFYPTLEDILKLSAQPVQAPAPAPAPLQNLEFFKVAPQPIQTIASAPAAQQTLPNIDSLKFPSQPIPDGLVKLLTSQLSTIPASSLKPSYTSWLLPDVESNSIAQIDAKGIEVIQETKDILATTESPIFDLNKLLFSKT